MEGVGARFGRSSRYAPATSVFTGPVRKWRKKWVPVTPSSSSSAAPNPNPASSFSNHNKNNQLKPSFVNGVINGSHVQLYKWAPLSESQSSTTAHNTNVNGSIVGAGNNGRKKNKGSDGGDKDSSPVKDEGSVEVELPPKRRFKYIPVALLEAQLEEEEEQAEDEAKSDEPDETVVEAASKTSSFAEKPDINDVPMEETEDQDDNQVERQDLNKSTLDLSLGLTTHDSDQDSDSQAKQE